jgi:hypothetical protein
MVVMVINREPVTDAATARSLLREGRNLLFVYTRGAVRSLVVVIER